MRKHILLIVLIFATSVLTFGQTNKLKLKIDSLKYYDNKMENCHSVFWRIVAGQKESIPLLIDKLSDTTLTKAKDKCKKTALRVGDLAYLSLKEIMGLPLFLITQTQFDVISEGCQQGVFDYIELNRTKFKEQVKAYYSEKEKKLKWVQYDSNHLTPCRVQNNIRGQYREE